MRSNKKPAAGSTIAQRIRICHFDGKCGPCSASDGCDVYGSSRSSILQFTTILIKNAFSIRASILKLVVALFSQNGAVLARDKASLTVLVEIGSHSSDSTTLRST